MRNVPHRARLRGGDVMARGACGHEWPVSFRYARPGINRIRERLNCPTCRRQVGVSFDFEGRTCEVAGCGNPLSRHNPGPNCFACDEKHARRKVARVIAA